MGLVSLLTAFATTPKRPAVRALDVATTEETAAEGQLAAPRPGERLVLTLKRWPKHGRATLDPMTGSFRYQPEKDFNGDDGFTVDVGAGAKATSTIVSVHVAPENDAPSVTSAAVTVQEDGTTTSRVEARDVDGDILTFHVQAPPPHGQVRIEPRTGAFTYRPRQDFSGADTFTIGVSDGAATVRADVSVIVTPVNDAPVAEVLTRACREDTPCEGKALATDAEGDALTWKLVTQGKHGVATIDSVSGAFTFTPHANFHGDDAIALEVSDGSLKESSVVRVMVASVNDEPVAAAASASADEDSPASGRVMASDVDRDTLSYRLGRAPEHGSATVDPLTGTFTYVGDQDSFGTDTFTVEVSDGVATTPVPVQVSIAPVNDAPVATASTHALDEDTSLEASCLTVMVSDGALSSAPAQVVATIAAVNDAPVASAATVSTTEDVEVSVNLRASDVDGDALSFSIARAPSHGELTLLDPARGAYLYTPKPNWNGDDGFAFTVNDPAGLASTAELKVVVAPGNDAPVAMGEDLSVACHGQVTGLVKGFDRETKQVSFRLLGAPSQGHMKSFDARTGQFVLDLENVNEREVVFRFVASDGSLEYAPAEVHVHTTCSGMARLVR